MDTQEGGKDLVELIEALKKDEKLLDEHASCSQQAWKQIWHAYALLMGAAQDSQATRSQSMQSQLDALMRESHSHMTSVHHANVERRWRRLFVDAALLKALLFVAFSDCSNDELGILHAIHDLDMAIIVAGAPGVRRADLVHRTISILQSRLGGSASSESQPCKPNPPRPAVIPPCRASKKVKELPCLPSMSAYMRIYHQEPFVVRGAASDWPALQPYQRDKHTRATSQSSRWSSATYLQRISGRGRVVPIEIGTDYTAEDWTQSIVPWFEFLAHSGWCDGVSTESQPVINYLAQHDLFAQFPDLMRDVRVPDLVYSGPPAPPYRPDYTPPLDAEDGTETVLINAWMGPQGTVSPPHRDPYYNCYTQVVGHKLVWIAPFDSPINTSDGVTSSDIDVFALSACSDPQQERFTTNVEPLAMFADLSPGDVLVMPPGWFHALKSLTRSFSVSMWF